MYVSFVIVKPFATSQKLRQYTPHKLTVSDKAGKPEGGY